jgi:RNA polymerase sigma-70 factor (ECF subfamily)
VLIRLWLIKFALSYNIEAHHHQNWQLCRFAIPFHPKKVFITCNIPLKTFTLYKTAFLAIEASIPTADVLVRQCIEGDTDAYRVLYDRYSKAMFNTALRIVSKVPDAEDVLQDSFIDAYTQLSSFENRSTFGAWLKQIVVFKSIALLKRRRINFVDIETASELPEEDEIDESGTWYTVDMIKQTIQQLPDGYRTVLSLYLFEGYDHDEIAEILGVAQSTVRTQYIRAKQKLLQLLKKGKVYEQ